MDRRMTVYGTSYYKRLLSIPRERVLCVDTETTGLDPEKDEVLQLSLVDGNGNVLFSSYLKPATRRRWPKAQEVHGITWVMVKDAPTMHEVRDEVQALIDASELIVGYNVSFDQSMLRATGISFGTRLMYDVMDDYAQVWGRWSDRKGDYLWAKLGEATRRFGIPLDAHDATDDAKATAKLFYAMLGSDGFGTASEARDAEIERQREEGARQQAELEKIERSQRHGEIVVWIIIAVIILLVIGIPLLLMSSCIARFS